MVDGTKETTLGLGERLRSARKANALTLQQAAFTLRLEESVLRALEDERYDALGASVFVRGHLKAYARLLGLSEEAILAAYRHADPNADTPPKVTREREKPLTTTPGPFVILIVVGFALLLMLLVYAVGSGDEPARPRAASVPSQEAISTVDRQPAPAPGRPEEFATPPPAPLPVIDEAGEVPAPAALPVPATEPVPALQPAAPEPTPDAPVAPPESPASVAE
jgi:cytoskeleton protein RodZ